MLEKHLGGFSGPHHCRKGDPFRVLRVGSCLTLGNELRHVLTKQETSLERGTQVENRRIKETRELLCPVTRSLKFRVMGLVSRLSLANSNSGSFLIVQPLLSQDGFQWGGSGEVGRTFGQASPPSFWPFPKSSCWWQLVSPEFLTRLSCCKITHGSGYYLSWTGWTVSVSISPNNFCWETSYSRFFLGIGVEVSSF